MADMTTRILDINKLLDEGKIPMELANAMCIAAAGASYAGVRPAPPVNHGGVPPSETIVSQETQQAKALRELKAHVESFLGTMERIVLNKIIMDFTLYPQNVSAFAKARLENLFREAGLSPTGQGTQLLLILKGATCGQPIADLAGDGPAHTLARAMVWDYMCRILAIYAVCQQERLNGTPLSAKERQNMEDTYVSKVLKPQEAGDGGNETARVLLNALGWVQKQEEVTQTTLKREANHDTTPLKNLKGNNGQKTPQTPKTPPAPKMTPVKGGPMPTVKDIPHDFKSWEYADKMAWVHPHGLCWVCIEIGKITVGTKPDHKNH